jgi:hypothetical protein
MKARHDERGFSAPVFIVLIAAMVMFLGGISVDLWRVLAEHRKVTGLADGASIAAATAVDLDLLYAQPDQPAILQPAEAVSRACDYLARNGVTASCPGEVAIDVIADEVTVELRREVPLTLLAFLSAAGGNGDPIEVAARSTSQLQRGVP